MKKLLVIALLMLALVITAVACQPTPDEPDTSADDVTTAETPTEAPTDEPSTPAPETEPETPAPETPAPETDPETPAPETDPETPAPETEPETPAPETEPPVDPMEPVLMIEPEAIASAAGTGNNSAGEVATEGNRTFARLKSTGGDPFFSLISGAGVMPNYLVISYRTDCPLPGEFFVGSGAGATGQGDYLSVDWVEDGAWNLMIIDLSTCGVTSIEGGNINFLRMDFFTDHYVDKFIDVQYVGFFNTPEAAQKYDFKVNPPYVEADDPAAGKKNHSFDTFYVNNQMYFPEDGGAGDKLTAQDNTITFAPGEVHDSMILRGWIGFEQPIVEFGYYLDNYKMVFNPDYTKPTEDGVKAEGGEHASRFEILVPLAHLVSNDHFAGFVVKLEDGTIVRLRENITVDLADDITDTFISDVASNEDGTDLQASDLANFFTITYGAADPHVVSGGMYQYGGINELYTAVDGLYAFSINMLEAANTAMAFVRGTRVVHSVDLPAVDGGLYPINNYYETDGQGRMGGAGIYAALYNGRLNLMIKSYDDETRTHQINRDYSIVAEGTNLTIADDGSTIYFLVDGNLLATVALSGSTSYEKICDLAEGITFAQTAVVTLADGTTDTIENTLVVATVQSQLGIAVRPAAIKFDSIKVEGLSSVTIPSEFYVHVPKENVALNKPVDADSVENETNIPSNATDGDDTTRWGATPNGVANLIVDLGEVYDLIGLDVYFENASWEYTISLSQDGVEYTVIAENTSHGAKMVSIEVEAKARYIKFTRLDDSAVPSTPHWFSIYEVYAYTKAAEEEPETPVVPEEPAVENYLVPQSQWVITGHNTQLNDTTNPMVAAGGIESAALLHQGSIALGEVDLSKYSKVVVMWGCDNSQVTIDHYNANANNRIMLLNAVMDGVMSPAAETIIAGGTYELKGWAVTAFEIDLTGIDYNGPVWLAIDALPGTFALVSSVEFVA